MPRIPKFVTYPVFEGRNEVLIDEIKKLRSQVRNLEGFCERIAILEGYIKHLENKLEVANNRINLHGRKISDMKNITDVLQGAIL